MEPNLKTTIRVFNFDVSTPEGEQAWKEFRAARKSGPRCHGPVISDLWHAFKPLDGQVIELERTHLFANQWNSAPIDGVSDKGLRVFDYALESFDTNTGCPRRIRRGHYLEQTPEMQEARRNTNVCGWCGYQEHAPRGSVFCPRCIGSEYLEASRLYSTRMVAIENSDRDKARAPLSDAEREHLLPLYRHAQLHGNTERDKARIAKARADIIAEATKVTHAALVKRDGFLWFMDRGIRTDNLIFYSHTGRFCFGWRKPVGAELLSAVLDVISEFPFPYDIETARDSSGEGRTLSGN